MPYYWISFVDPELPEGHRNIGIAVIQSSADGDTKDGIKQILKECWIKKINPGGSAAICQVPYTKKIEPLIDRLTTKDRLTELELA